MQLIPNRRSITGLTILETVSLIVVAVVLAITFFSWFSSYRLKSKASEAQTNLKLIFNAEVVYYQNSEAQVKVTSDPRRGPVNHKQFLPLSPQPAIPKATPQIGNFTSGDWALLNISITKPVYYSYSVETSGMGLDATFTALAKGDLDGDQHFSRWEMIGRLDPNEKIKGTEIVYSLDPLE